MTEWLVWARGPMFRFALLIMILGLVRQIALGVFGIGSALWFASDRKLPIKNIIKATLAWLKREREPHDWVAFVGASAIFHIGFIAVALFFAGHVALWRRGLGFGWPAFGRGVADVLTIAALLMIAVIFVARLVFKAARDLSRFQDYAMLILMALPLITGFLAAHPSGDPIPYATTMFLHVMSGNLIMILLPFTKLSHSVLIPSTQLVGEVAWHFPPDAGERVAAALGKDESLV
ncbi:MAG: respiratory nitrate reductase subunit gamma [Planctomycetes bacterium]|nr:respiratory nitrate reductase subunit gamma [Planctomycetota bacterium]